MGSIENQLLELIARVYDAMGWPGVVLLMAIESASIPLPSELVMPLSGWMLIQAKGLSAWNVVAAGFYGALGNLLGSLVAYWVGAWGGRPLLERYGRYVLISRGDLERADRWFARYGSWAVFLSRMLPVVRTFISFPAGVVRMPLLRFCVLTFLGSFPWSLGLAYGGYVLGENWEALRRVMRPFDIPILLVLAVLVGLYVYRHVRHWRDEA
ncbi:MAG: DedA family protein, partial [Dehalococcoidia bacterium]|nr:DedA family protein [Dehalococcoidia bacterium]